MFFYGKTDIGRKRSTNQDNFLTVRLDGDILLFVLCDGMGGTVGGNIASGLAVRSFVEYIENTVSSLCDQNGELSDYSVIHPYDLLREAAATANAAVFKRSRENSQLSNMGTTLVAALVYNGKMYIANIGDSRLYTCQNGRLEQLTHDHSYVQMLVDMQRITKEEAATNPRRNILTRALGTESRVEPDISDTDIPANGAYYLLCSDGLYNFMTEEEMASIISAPAEDYDDDYEAELCDKITVLIDRANEGGGGDNITAILIKEI